MFRKDNLITTATECFTNLDNLNLLIVDQFYAWANFLHCSSCLKKWSLHLKWSKLTQSNWLAKSVLICETHCIKLYKIKSTLELKDVTILSFQFEILEELRRERIDELATLIQKTYRGHVNRQKWHRLRGSQVRILFNSNHNKITREGDKVPNYRFEKSGEKVQKHYTKNN